MKPKIQITISRDEDEPVLIAYMVIDGKPLKMAAISSAVCEAHPEVFDTWKDAIVKVVGLVLDSNGYEVTSTTEFTQADLN
jgi:hypothetical protein